MRMLILAAATVAAALAACGKPAPTIEPVESLVANPERLNELRAQCKADHAKVGDAQCNAVAEATRQRFMRAAPSPYENDPVSPPPPAATTTAPATPAASAAPATPAEPATPTAPRN